MDRRVRRRRPPSRAAARRTVTLQSGRSVPAGASRRRRQNAACARGAVEMPPARAARPASSPSASPARRARVRRGGRPSVTAYGCVKRLFRDALDTRADACPYERGSTAHRGEGAGDATGYREGRMTMSSQRAGPRTSSPQASEADAMSTVSVVIPAFNAERTIGTVIEALLEQKPRVGEVIVVDDGSEDRTAEMVAKLGTRVI